MMGWTESSRETSAGAYTALRRSEEQEEMSQEKEEQAANPGETVYYLTPKIVNTEKQEDLVPTCNVENH